MGVAEKGRLVVRGEGIKEAGKGERLWGFWGNKKPTFPEF